MTSPPTRSMIDALRKVVKRLHYPVEAMLICARMRWRGCRSSRLPKRPSRLLQGQRPLLDATLSETGQALAQRHAAQLIALSPSASSITRAEAALADPGELGRYQEVDLDSLDLVRPRSVGVEHAALSAMRQCGFEDKLAALGLNRPQIGAAVGNIVARMAHPGSELATHAWLQQRSALGEHLLRGHCRRREQ